jgi:hypothetical protein
VLSEISGLAGKSMTQNAAGVRPWDRVAVLKANDLDVTLLASAIARLGAIPATLGWTHTPEFARAMLTRLDKPA